MAHPDLPQEVDREGDLLHPSEAQHIFGHDEAMGAFVKALEHDHLPSAWLLSGEKGIGKASLAYEMARMCFGHRLDQEAQHHSHHLVRTRQHPQLYRLVRLWPAGDKKPKSVISVEQVRQLSQHLHHRARTGVWRIVVIDSVDELNLNAANALLKILEEPPERVMFMLISHQAGRLLPTLRSRTRNLSLKPLDQASMLSWIEATPCIDASLKPLDNKLIDAAEGVPLKLVLLATDGQAIRHSLDAFLDKIAKRRVTGQAKDLQTFVDGFTARGAEGKRETLWYFLEQTVRQRALFATQTASTYHVSSAFADLWFHWREERLKAETYNLDQKQLLMKAILDLGRQSAKVLSS